MTGDIFHTDRALWKEKYLSTTYFRHMLLFILLFREPNNIYLFRAAFITDF